MINTNDSVWTTTTEEEITIAPSAIEIAGPADITIEVDGVRYTAKDVIRRLNALEEMVGILSENPAAHPALKNAYDKYKMVEKLARKEND